MNIEEEIFKKSICNYEKLKKYGFRNNEYNTLIMDNTFKVVIVIDDNIVKGRIFDIETNTEYTNYRLEENGSFSNKIKNEYINVLTDIKNKCFDSKLFIYDQSNRVSNYIKDKYNVNPEFLFKDDYYTGVFRENNKKKWFGIIMYVDKSKFSDLSGKVEVINVKINPNDLGKLLEIDGIYKAYHMNKKSWITITLDDKLSDRDLFELVDNSFKFVSK